jgi:G3E family GTPase
MIVDVAFGFLGSGKTTFITQVLKAWGADEKIVVLVNEFGEVGIDGELLASRGGDVVEMPSGCICCTLQTDFRTQLLDISRSIEPERVIIEPTGVATIGQIEEILASQLFEQVIDELHKILVIDATGFMELYRANRSFVESQVESAHIVLLNKCDLVDKKKAMLTRSAVAGINPEIAILKTVFGAVDWDEYRLSLTLALGSAERPAFPGEQTQLRGTGKETSSPFPLWHSTPEHPEEDSGVHHFHEEENALGYESIGFVYDETSFDRKKLEELFQRLIAAETGMGAIVRAKGIFRCDDRWVLMEIASKEYSSQPVRSFKQSKVSIIGKDLKKEILKAAFEECASG